MLHGAIGKQARGTTKEFYALITNLVRPSSLKGHLTSHGSNSASRANSSVSTTTKYRPFDATKCKPGDPVVLVEDGEIKRRGRFIAYVEDAVIDYRALVMWDRADCCRSYTVDGRLIENRAPEVFLPLDPLDEIDPSPGNVDKLTRRQVGEGYRIPAHDESAPGNEDIWLPLGGYWDRRTVSGAPYACDSTYRVPIAPAMVPLEQSDIVLGKTVVRIKERESRGEFLVIARCHEGLWPAGTGTLLTWAELRNFYKISFDHGDTWQAAEKPKGGAK